MQVPLIVFGYNKTFVFQCIPHLLELSSLLFMSSYPDMAVSSRMNSLIDCLQDIRVSEVVCVLDPRIFTRNEFNVMITQHAGFWVDPSDMMVPVCDWASMMLLALTLQFA
ncbi:67_t:CDS:2 [Ambispora gerdemannii]|uniref:67_t:CDS:1 n=1 Tax=Ambispora gerdemannii TaxID=144530 RepID=A0A9N9FYB3_9GLOM|nr:67_t:CDS:2 [Ambispora gerdemannii]